MSDKVFLRVEEVKPRFIRLFEVLEWIGHIAYRLALSPKFSAIHNVIVISKLHNV